MKDSTVLTAGSDTRARTHTFTSAVASLSRLSPSRIAVTRPETPMRLTIVVATASVGLTIAPSAIPQASDSPGITAAKKEEAHSDAGQHQQQRRRDADVGGDHARPGDREQAEDDDDQRVGHAREWYPIGRTRGGAASASGRIAE